MTNTKEPKMEKRLAIRASLAGVASALLFSASALAVPTCYQVQTFTYFGVQSLTSVTCSSTPSGFGWYQVLQAPTDIRTAVPLNLGLDGCSVLLYQDDSGSGPIVTHDLIPGIGCSSEPFPLTTTPPVAVGPASGPRLWLKSDAGVTPPSGRVSHWADQSGFGSFAYMPTPSRQPFLVSGALNGLPVLRFNGAQSLILSPFVSPSRFTIFIVGKNSRTSESFSMILGPAGSGPNNQLRWENGSQALSVGTGNNLPVTQTTIGNTRVNHALAVSYNGSTFSVYRDGSLVATRSFATTGPWTLGQIGAWFSSYFLIGDLAEILVYDRALTDSERNQTSAYLRSRYALP
jgi:hypothetical protein